MSSARQPRRESSALSGVRLLCVALVVASGCGLLERLEQDKQDAQNEALGEAIAGAVQESMNELQAKIDSGERLLTSVLAEHPYRGNPDDVDLTHLSLVDAAGVAAALQSELPAYCVEIDIEIRRLLPVDRD